MNQVITTAWYLALMGGGGSGGAWLITKNSIAYLLRDTVIPTNLHYQWGDENIWDEAKSRFISDKNDSDKFKTDSLKALAKESIQTSQMIMRWCFKHYDVVYKSIFNRPNPEILKIRDDVSNYCKVTIGEKFKDANQFKDENSKGLKEAVKKVQHATLYREYITDDEPSLHIVKQTKNEKQALGELLSWCKNEYKKGYQGRTTLRYQRAIHFCYPDS